MDWQVIYLLALATASWPVRSSPWLVFVMWANLGACALSGWDIRAMVVSDLVCGLLLMAGTNRMVIVGSLFLAMLPVYAVASFQEWPLETTYARVEALAYIQMFVMGRADVGMGLVIGWAKRRLLGLGGLGVGGHGGFVPAQDKGRVAVVSRPDRKVKVSR